MKRTFRSMVRNLGFVTIIAANNFVLIAACMGLAALGAILMIKNGLIPGDFYTNPLTMLNFAFLLGITVSIITAVISSRLSKLYIRIPLNGMKKLARGDFNTRIDFGYLPMPQEFDELAAAFNEMAKELSGIEMMRADFINNFSHEFKTPIVSLRGFAKQLQKHDLTEQQRTEYTDIIVSETDRLSQLATNILNLTKLENQIILTGRVSYNLAEQLRQAILLLEKKWTAKKMELELNMEEAQFTGNEQMLAQVWTNLLDNAIKFSSEGSKLRVNLFGDEQQTVVQIQDFGCGMDETTSKYIFDKLYQGDVSHAIEGNGLGLSIVLKIVELHKGSIQVQSALRKGSIFTVTLPNEM
ncbi:HAMP domain-containing sensor histidine kinase [Paenibacillus sp. S150]|uniref:HAMP domain-containing sensor histidine kinase n=1 Tax=Paenibacillus sp. S150 TaxID=2749826 RepID=UPI001C562057|nr:HAMP domain-containing sensor histidine kinase [Paenibacillus sp. S150]MBW4084315.1 HAMP domain-containing histidine kinase [Paenibacillus sp. S150]